jgi:hypothetical protein
VARNRPERRNKSKEKILKEKESKRQEEKEKIHVPTLDKSPG